MPVEQKPQRRMTDINVIETSGVDHPAHGREGWLVKKSAGAGRASRLEQIMKGTAMPTTKEALLKAVGESDLPDAQKAVMTKAIDLTDDVNAAAELWQSLRAKQEAGDPAIPTVETPAAPAAPGVPVAAAAPEAPAVDIFKSVTDPAERAALQKAVEENPSMAKAFEAIAKTAADALEKAATEEATRLDAEAIAKSKAAYSHLGIDHDTVAKAIRRMDAETAEAVTKALGVAEGQLEAAGMFKEIGHAEAAPAGSPMAKAATIADALVAAGTVKTHAEGVAKAFADNPELYSAHENEGTR